MIGSLQGFRRTMRILDIRLEDRAATLLWRGSRIATSGGSRHVAFQCRHAGRSNANRFATVTDGVGKIRSRRANKIGTRKEISVQGQNCAQEASCLPTERTSGLRTITSLQGGLEACLQGNVSLSPVVQLSSIFSWVRSIQASVAVCEIRKTSYGFFDPSSAQSDSALADLRRHGSSNL